MKYLDKDKINNGKRFINVAISMVIFLNLISLAVTILRKDTIGRNDIIYDLLVLVIIAFYYKGNKLAGIIVSSIAPFLFIIPALLIFGATIYILQPFGILSFWGGTLFLIILAVYIGIMYLIFRRIGWFQCIEEYKLYRKES
ncbi:hypothetical protein [Clostridium manihotivorum]|uniref:Uncharacterized protein n=1 Tax=Clostridium manihotivorum TaxID=2320868 RepID=A0A3R5UFD5_9CLOT|nr:hypothetical protein [Clostridium manihotivorum]QAA32265.1 hypothetical protein C1I91_11785 [Clostridium manihotivorum]